MAGSSASAWARLVMLQGAVAGWMPLDPEVPDQNRHLGSRCERCHLAGDAVTPETARRPTTTRERMCGRCKKGGVEASHPTGFVSARPLPAAFPLDWRGEVTCGTCHDVHKPKPGRPRVARKGRAFCLSCHAAEVFESMPEAGMSLMASGHLDARSEPAPSERIDPLFDAVHRVP